VAGVTTIETVVLDADVVIGLFDAADPHHQRAVELLTRRADSALS
jgi:predicted nucleic acid-binding protein